MRARRAILYVPGDDLKKIHKAATLTVDCVCLDMEDGVALNRKEQARSTILEALNSIDFPDSEKLVRINPTGSGFLEEDLRQAVRGKPDGIIIPKVESAETIEWAHQSLSEFERDQGWPDGAIRLLAAVESALGIVHLDRIACASARLEAIIFGAEDFASSVGATRSRQGWEVLYARSAVLTYTSAYNLQAIDMVYVDYKNIPGLVEEARLGAQLGFTGKQIIHPAQVEPVQEAFTPDQEAIDRAVRLIKAFEEGQSAGKGVVTLDGKMVEAPMIRAAERVLVKARAAGRMQ
ncbi:MAG: hypothetical protein A2Z16_08595 [Chloroflexi bacterium RBG_16_54_18]|nr:MAG: hypothetical protein A2Z16_08595 [Chloroflexi bacterium RBG_16_54_18]